ncbi:hypothetical protein [Streptomyces sp. NBC_00094]|uniref:hypothetical protein n=1 Tax=Streptomyces sp. NBC_00094 TaxID=2903620 RepID=UPI002255A8A6|nr:hypothetical protein [Streptomyces sp. NBC_00094]MCX5393819.1 hypothetical protein [Streptomyces sp. NBC_00094]
MANRSETPAVHPHGSSTAPQLRGSWLARGKEGRFSVYLPRNGEVVRWTESADGRWSEPVSLGGGLTQGLSVGQGRDGYAHLVGWRPLAGGEPDHVELVHTTQYQTGRPALEWKSLGHPNKVYPWTGTPSVTVDGIGRAYVFSRNGGGGISVRAQKDAGGWHPWWDLLGSKTDPSPVALTNGDGFVELYTSHATGLLRYVQRESGGKPIREAILPTQVTMGTMAGVTGPSGHATVFYLDQEGRVCVWSPERMPQPMPLLDAVGTGPLSATRCVIDGFDHTVLAQQSADGRLALAAYQSEREMSGVSWTETGDPQGPLVTTLTQGADGGLVVMALVGGTSLITTRQKAGADSLLLEAWRPVR